VFHSHWITASGQSGSEGDDRAKFPYWSFTKTVIAIVALKLVKAGKLDLDASIPGQHYTLRHLLAHTSGLPDYGQFPAYHQAVARQDKPWSRSEMLHVAMPNGTLFEPGQGWSYSNIGYMFVRDMIEAASGEALGQVIVDLIAEPLGLSSVELAQTQAQFAKTHWPAATSYDPGWVYHGCLIGTARDAAKLLHALMIGELLEPNMFENMLSRTDLGGAIPGRPWVTCGYGLGLMSGSVNLLGKTIGHSGAGPFCVNAVYHFPERDDPITVAVFTDGNDEGTAENRAVSLEL
jgi:D-alanyl-D-alanine carboxypeptidase